VDVGALIRAQERLAAHAEAKATPADIDAALARARAQIEELAAAAAQVRGALPEQIGDAVREGIHDHARPLGRQLAEVRGLLNQTLRRLEHLEHELAAERSARVDDLGLLVDLIAEGWRNVGERLDRIERAATASRKPAEGAVVYRLDDRLGS
jgi:ABC-type transporter Mla subunit MlaD